jgi:hypothetical protein
VVQVCLQQRRHEMFTLMGEYLCARLDTQVADTGLLASPTGVGPLAGELLIHSPTGQYSRSTRGQG